LPHEIDRRDGRVAARPFREVQQSIERVQALSRAIEQVQAELVVGRAFRNRRSHELELLGRDGG